MTRFHNRLRHMRTAERRIPRNFLHALERNRRAQFRQLARHLFRAPKARLAEFFQHGLKVSSVPVHPVTQDMHFGGLHVCGKLDPGNDRQRRAVRGGERGGESVRRVVVGNGNDVQPAFERELDELGGRQFAVGRVGMGVQIDAARHAV
jgi:hypothetical protein